MTGRYRVVPHWNRWSLEDLGDPDRKQPIYDHQRDAQAEADRRNQRDTRKAARPSQPAQPDLFNQQETA